MFKASIIENQSYYSYKRRIALVGIVGLPLFATFSNLFVVPSWWIVLIVLSLWVLILVFQNRIMSKMNAVFGKRKLIADYDEIEERDLKSGQTLSYRLLDVGKIVIHTNFEMYQTTFSDIFNELFKGQTKTNCLEIRLKGEMRRIQFEYDSHYMIRQLEKIMDHWRIQGIPIEVHPSKIIRVQFAS